MPISNPVAAMSIGRIGDGTLQALVVTSRKTHRRVIPKSWPWPPVPDHEVKATEAHEEAGGCGHVIANKIGAVTYDKQRDAQGLRFVVAVFPLQVMEEGETWPESAERRCTWFSPSGAAAAVDQLELKALLRRLTSDRISKADVHMQ
jgi:hypothetical protein